ncbi:MAG: lysoplasmalogenase [Oscillospiraceae bacterium]|nr:lysoplasmalogenase [Oscillospiraceae bacterium]
MAAVIMAICGMCALAPYIFLRVKKRGLQAILMKVCVSIFFLLTAMAAALRLPQAELYQARYLCLGIVMGQVFGLLGDIWLDLKDMYPQHREPYMFAGFSSFFIGHMCYIAGLTASYRVFGAAPLIAAAAGAALTGLVLLTEKPMKLKYGKFKGITAGYSFVFGFIIALAFSIFFSEGNSRQALVMGIGLVVFLLSDLVLSGIYFGRDKDRPVHIALNYIFYYGGQFAIALSLLALAR